MLSTCDMPPTNQQKAERMQTDRKERVTKETLGLPNLECKEGPFLILKYYLTSVVYLGKPNVLMLTLHKEQMHTVY